MFKENGIICSDATAKIEYKLLVDGYEPFLRTLAMTKAGLAVAGFEQLLLDMQKEFGQLDFAAIERMLRQNQSWAHLRAVPFESSNEQKAEFALVICVYPDNLPGNGSRTFLTPEAIDQNLQNLERAVLSTT